MYAPGVRRTAEEARRTREALLDAALSVFAERGVQASTLADVASRAGVTRGAVYHHFANKDSVLRAVLAEPWDLLAETAWAELEGSGGSGPDLASRLDGFAEAWLRALRTDRRLQALLQVSMSGEAARLARADGPAGKTDGYRSWAERLAVTFAAAPDELVPGTDPAEIAAHVLAWCGTAHLAGIDHALLARSAPRLRGVLR